MRWYERSKPTIENALPYIKEAANDIIRIKGVTSVHAFGSFAENINNKKAAIKDIDLLVKCNFNSGDLLAIDKTENGPFNIKTSELEYEGFNPLAVSFTNKYLKFSQYNIDQWAISKDKKVLHWGPISEKISEWKDMRKQAEEEAYSISGISQNRLCKANTSQREKWIESYNNYIFNFISDEPVGWYSSDSSIENVMDNSIKLAGR